MAEPLWKLARDGNLKEIDRLTQSEEGKEKINSDVDGVSDTHISKALIHSSVHIEIRTVAIYPFFPSLSLSLSPLLYFKLINYETGIKKMVT